MEDPFGRRATFTYTPAGQLASITDVVWLTAGSGYGPDDFVNTLTTPYGTTSFRHEPKWFQLTARRFAQATKACGLRPVAGGLAEGRDHRDRTTKLRRTGRVGGCPLRAAR